MSVRKKDGSWWVDFMFNGERLRKRTMAASRTEALMQEGQFRREVLLQGSISAVLKAMEPKPEDRSVTFAEFAEEWLATYVRTNNRASEQRTKAGVMRKHLLPHFGELKLEAVQRREIEAYKSAKLDEGLVPKTINNHLTILGKCLRTALEDNVIPSVPLIKWLKRKPAEFDYLMPAESHRLLQNRTEPLWTDMARLALRTGLRRGELMALDWSAIDLAHKRLTVRTSLVDGVMEAPKSNVIRHLPLTEDVVAMLSRSPRRKGTVFQNPVTAKPMTKHLMELGLDRLCRRTGLRHIGWHVLRHTFASQLAMAGVPILTIKELMGHSSIQMTMRYAHLSPSTLALAVPLLLQAEEQAIASNCHAVVTNTLTPAL